jgi:hypothetical protein
VQFLTLMKLFLISMDKNESVENYLCRVKTLANDLNSIYEQKLVSDYFLCIIICRGMPVYFQGVLRNLDVTMETLKLEVFEAKLLQMDTKNHKKNRDRDRNRDKDRDRNRNRDNDRDQEKN